MAISANNPRLSNQIKSDVPEIQQKEAALLKMDPTNVADLEFGAKRLTEISSGNWQFQVWNGLQWVNVGKLKMDVDTVDGYDASITPKANTLAVRGSDGKLQDSITGNAKTADSAATLSETLVIGKGGTGATTSEQARVNLGVPPTSHASANTTYGLSSESEYGHAKASSDAPAQDTDTGNVGVKVSEFARGDHSHKKVLGNAVTYGQVKLTDSVSDESAASSSIAASAKAVKDTYAKASALMTGATASAAGTSGNVPAPKSGDEDKCLMGNATFRFPLELRKVNPILSPDEDTPASWITIGSGVFGFGSKRLNGQPTSSGLLVNFVYGNTVFQIWIGNDVDALGKLYSRRGFQTFDNWNEYASGGEFLPITGGTLTGELHIPSTLQIFAEGSEGGQIQLNGGSTSSQGAVLDQQANYFRVFGTSSKNPVKINLDTGEFEGTFRGAFPNVFCGRFTYGFTLPAGGTWYAVGVPDHGGTDARISPIASAAGGSYIEWSFGGYSYAVFAVRYK